jgi:hypothetical protein
MKFVLRFNAPQHDAFGTLELNDAAQERIRRLVAEMEQRHEVTSMGTVVGDVLIAADARDHPALARIMVDDLDYCPLVGDVECSLESYDVGSPPEHVEIRVARGLFWVEAADSQGRTFVSYPIDSDDLAPEHVQP